MATTSRSVGQEGRSAATSLSNTSHSPGSRRQSSTDKEKSEKHIPNYLKPTISSRNESLKPVKKNGHEDQKFLRRRSFDSRPPSSSATSQRTPLSPRRRDSTGPVLRERKITVRSTSYSARTMTASSKPVSDTKTSSKTTKAAVKSHAVPSRATRKPTTSTNNKKEYNASPSMDDTCSHDTTQSLEHESKEEENESVIHEVEEVVKVESEIGVHSDLPKSKIEEDIVDDVIDRNTEVHSNGENEKIKSCDISTVPEDENEDVLQTAAVQIEEIVKEDKSHEVDIVPQQEPKEEEGELDESSNSQPEETVIEEAKTEVEDRKGLDDRNTTEELASTDETREEKELHQEKEKEGEEVSEELKAKEEQTVEGDGENTKTKQDNALATIVISKRQDQGQGKKESPTAYNDVIEETATKLLEKRKNKVKALVGAFETVIDYESSSTSK